MYILGRDMQTGQLVHITLDALLRGMTSIGKPGTGKTTLMESIILQHIQAGGGVCYLDPHRDSIDMLLSRIPAEREKDVILLDLVDETAAPGLNLFECQNVQDKDEVSRVTSAVLDIFGKL